MSSSAFCSPVITGYEVHVRYASDGRWEMKEFFDVNWGPTGEIKDRRFLFWKWKSEVCDYEDPNIAKRKAIDFAGQIMTSDQSQEYQDVIIKVIGYNDYDPDRTRGRRTIWLNGKWIANEYD